MQSGYLLIIRLIPSIGFKHLPCFEEYDFVAELWTTSFQYPHNCPTSSQRRVRFTSVMLAVVEGFKEYIKTKPGVSNVKCHLESPVDQNALEIWQVTNECSLPEDLTHFYLTTDGLQLSWQCTFEETCVTVGKICINKLNSLQRCTLEPIPNVSGVLTEVDYHELLTHFLPSTEASRWPVKLFELEFCDNSSVVVLSLDVEIPGIYLINRDAQLHRLCDNFDQYLRLALVHLGILDWQCFYTNADPSPQAAQYHALYIPERLAINSGNPQSQLEASIQSLDASVFNARKAFKIEPAVLPLNRGFTRGGRTQSSNRTHDAIVKPVSSCFHNGRKQR